MYLFNGGMYFLEGKFFNFLFANWPQQPSGAVAETYFFFVR